MRPKSDSTQDTSQPEIVECETVHTDERGIASRCANPLCAKPVETQAGAVWIRRTCSDSCRNMLSSFRRVAVGLFPELQPTEAIEMLLARVKSEAEFK
jgi:hypothetical protein